MTSFSGVYATRSGLKVYIGEETLKKIAEEDRADFIAEIQAVLEKYAKPVQESGGKN